MFKNKVFRSVSAFLLLATGLQGVILCQSVPDLGVGASLNGARPFPANSAWNIDISRYPVHPNSANLIASIGTSTGLHPDFGTFWQGAPIGIPYMIVAGNQQKVPINFTSWPEQSDAGPYPFPANAPVEGGTASDGDRHVLVIDRDNWKLYETYYSFPVNSGASWNAASGAAWDLFSNKLRPLTWTSADAAGLPIFPGLVRRDEVLRGEIRHAFRFTASTSRRAFVYPATHQAGSTDSVNAPPMGVRVRLKSTFNVNNANFSPGVRIILRAMQKYGMILADNGSNWYVSGTHDPAWDDGELSVLNQVKGSDFEVVQAPAHLIMPRCDFDGDGRADVAVRRPSDNVWYQLRSSGVYTGIEFGVAGDKSAAADFDGDGRTDVAVFRPSTGTWYIAGSSVGFYTQSWGTAGDIPVPADYDGDGKADIAVFRPSNGTWYLQQSSNGIAVRAFGTSEDEPQVADYDGDGKADVAVRRPSNNTWYFLRTSAGYTAMSWGTAGDVAMTGDFDGDGKADPAVFRPSTGVWFLARSQQGFATFNWGKDSDIPAPADYDADGKTDIAVFRPSTGTWYLWTSYSGIQQLQFGATGDAPLSASSGF
ncbi:MAG TPA: VCBS repeat-containing protein [Pyrinomonadaceae bacterium]|nr:VCBS repeat-containing protein [Pyrinomonadaceae bacterium]